MSTIKWVKYQIAHLAISSRVLLFSFPRSGLRYQIIVFLVNLIIIALWDPHDIGLRKKYFVSKIATKRSQNNRGIITKISPWKMYYWKIIHWQVDKSGPTIFRSLSDLVVKRGLISIFRVLLKYFHSQQEVLITIWQSVRN